MEVNRIVVIGAGNVATHMAIALKNSGFIIQQVFSRTLTNAEVLSQLVEAEAVDDLKRIVTDADLYIISVSDGKISWVVDSLPVVSGVVVHTSGSIDISVLNRFTLYGVMYPFQTFTRDKELDFLKVPVLTEGNNSFSKKVIQEVSGSISEWVQVANGKKRKALHIGAVFACNFVNHMYTLADDLLEKEGLDFSLLKPLIQETTQKALSMKPLHAQTGPARRGDELVIQHHVEVLNSGTLHHEIYKLISESINLHYS